MKKYRWVVRDISNGNGAEPGVKRPTYIWVFHYRQTARDKVREHKNNPRYAVLGPIERWSVTTVKRLYEQAAGSYYHRKPDRTYPLKPSPDVWRDVRR